METVDNGTGRPRITDLWNMPTLVRAALRRVRCRHCGVRIEQVPWARTRSLFTHLFEAEVLRRARDCSIAGVCRQLGLHWTSVMRLIERWVEESAARQFRKPLRVIGVDEVSYGRGKRKLLTIVWDHTRARVVWIGQGRERDTLETLKLDFASNGDCSVNDGVWRKYADGQKIKVGVRASSGDVFCGSL
jgi:transposase